MRPFLVSGVTVVSVILGLLPWALHPRLTVHVVVVPALALLATVLVGAHADRVPFAWWRGPACALLVLLAVAIAVPLCNGAELISDPESYGLRPFVAVMFGGAVPAVFAGLVCSAFARLFR